MNEEIRKEAEEILGTCTCIDDYKMRGRKDPQCNWCENEYEVIEAIQRKEAIIKELQKELNNSGDGRGEWHVNHSCVPKEQYWTLEKKLLELEAELKTSRGDKEK